MRYRLFVVVQSRKNDLSQVGGLILAHRARGMLSPKEVPMKGFVGDIEEMTEENSDFRRVLYTAHQMQLVLMALRPGEEIGEETHKDRTQFFRVEKGRGEVWIDGARQNQHCHYRPGWRAA